MGLLQENIDKYRLAPDGPRLIENRNLDSAYLTTVLRFPSHIGLIPISWVSRISYTDNT